jgi:hypothetical protein
VLGCGGFEGFGMADDDEIESWEESGLPFWKYADGPKT